MVGVERADIDCTKVWISAWAESDSRVMVVVQEQNPLFGMGCNIGAAHTFADVCRGCVPSLPGTHLCL